MPIYTPKDICALLPGYDCVYCGNPTCMSLARKIAAGVRSKADCIFLDKQAQAEIDRLLDEGVEVRPQSYLAGGKTSLEINPCTEDGMVTLEIQVNLDSGFEFIDPEIMCDILSGQKRFDEVKCSKEMGYTIINYEGKRIHVFKSGKIIMRRADDREDALRNLDMLMRVLLPSVICRCGNTAVECASGVCEGDCLLEIYSSLNVYDDDETAAAIAAKEVVDRLKDNAGFVSCLKALDEFMSSIKTVHEEFDKGKEVDIDKLRSKASDIKSGFVESYLTLQFKMDCWKEALQTIFLPGVLSDMERVLSGYIRAGETDDKDLFNSAGQIFFMSYESFRRNDETLSKEIDSLHQDFLEKWKQKGSDISSLIIANNGHLISKVLNSQVPG